MILAIRRSPITNGQGWRLGDPSRSGDREKRTVKDGRFLIPRSGDRPKRTAQDWRFVIFDQEDRTGNFHSNGAQVQGCDLDNRPQRQLRAGLFVRQPLRRGFARVARASAGERLRHSYPGPARHRTGGRRSGAAAERSSLLAQRHGRVRQRVHCRPHRQRASDPLHARQAVAAFLSVAQCTRQRTLRRKPQSAIAIHPQAR